MSSEKIKISLNPKGQYAEKRVFAAKSSAPGHVSVLSTNEVDGHPVVRLEFSNGAQPNDLTFLVAENRFLSILTTVTSPGVMEFLLGTEEDAAYQEVALELIQAKRTQEDAMWERANTRQKATWNSEARKEEIGATPADLTQSDRQVAEQLALDPNIIGKPQIVISEAKDGSLFRRTLQFNVLRPSFPDDHTLEIRYLLSNDAEELRGIGFPASSTLILPDHEYQDGEFINVSLPL